MSEPTQLESHRGVECFVTAEGKFQAKIEGRMQSFTTLKALHRAIDKDAVQAVPAIFLSHDNCGQYPAVAHIRAFERARWHLRARLANGTLADTREYYPYSEQLLTRLRDLTEREKAITQERRELLDATVHLNDHNLEDYRPQPDATIPSEGDCCE